MCARLASRPGEDGAAYIAVQLARTTRASTCVEEIVSSNGINIALGSALQVADIADLRCRTQSGGHACTPKDVRCTSAPGVVA